MEVPVIDEREVPRLSRPFARLAAGERAQLDAPGPDGLRDRGGIGMAHRDEGTHVGEPRALDEFDAILAFGGGPGPCGGRGVIRAGLLHDPAQEPRPDPATAVHRRDVPLAVELVVMDLEGDLPDEFVAEDRDLRHRRRVEAMPLEPLALDGMTCSRHGAADLDLAGDLQREQPLEVLGARGTERRLHAGTIPRPPRDRAGLCCGEMKIYTKTGDAGETGLL
jgi:hypothetical protein